MADKDKYGFDYKGTMPLNHKLFPETKPYLDEEGKWAVSNIKTRLEIDPETGKWYLFPTMMGGVDLPYEGAENAAMKLGKHFGIYDSKDEGDSADLLIHKYFDMLKKKPAEDKIIEELKGL